MDYRRYYGLRAARPIGYSTFLAPQLENYSLFATPFMDINKKLNKFVEEIQQEDMAAQSETETKGKIKPKGRKGEEKKSEEDKEKLPKETSQVDVNFGIVLNVATVEPKDLSIAFGKGNEIEVNVNQSDVELGLMEIQFSRNCSYKYQLPDDVDKKSLVALRTSDHYLIILPRDVLRNDLLTKSIKDAISSDADAATPLETESADLEASGSKGSDSKAGGTKKGSDSKESEPKKKEGPKTRRTAKSKAADAIADEVDESSKSERVFLNENGLTPVKVSRVLRPGLDILILRKYMVDLESYISTVRKFIENASFISRNSKTPEIRVRGIATVRTDSRIEERYVTSEKEKEKKKKLLRDLSGESGYTSSEKSEDLPRDATDESSTSSTKSG